MRKKNRLNFRTHKKKKLIKYALLVCIIYQNFYDFPIFLEEKGKFLKLYK